MARLSPFTPLAAIAELRLDVMAPRVGDVGGSRWFIDGLSPRGVQFASLLVGVLLLWSFEGDWIGVCTLVGDAVGVVARMVLDGEAGDSGRRNGEVRGEPKDRGDGLYVEGIDYRIGQSRPSAGPSLSGP